VTDKSKNYRGFLLTEMIVSLTVLATLLIMFALSLNGLARFNRYQLVRQRCIAAAQAQLDAITRTGEQIPSQQFQRLWPRLTAATKTSPGEGQWQDLELVEVTASGKSFGHEVKVQLCRYISTENGFRWGAKEISE
jgi:type II secretory pathway pseudopilin PulG